MANVGIVKISNELILQWLDFVGGNVRDVKFNFNCVDLVIEHPDMPEVESSPIPIVTPQYITTEDAMGHKVTIRETGGERWVSFLTK